MSVYCTWWIPAHLKCTQCSILLHLNYGYLLYKMYLFIADITKLIQTCLCDGVGPGSSHNFMRSRASHPAGPHGRRAPKTVNRAPIAEDGKVPHNLHSSL